MVLQPADNSLPAIAHVLNQMGDVMKGGIKPGKNIVKGSVRYATELALERLTLVCLWSQRHPNWYHLGGTCSWHDNDQTMVI